MEVVFDYTRRVISAFRNGAFYRRVRKMIVLLYVMVIIRNILCVIYIFKERLYIYTVTFVCMKMKELISRL